ncbi:hypothetical protein HPB128_177g1 [Helicobacter pylori B128]|nr:hypothetical protein HPB128_177g1 [Helicobacter pylori B128]
MKSSSKGLGIASKKGSISFTSKTANSLKGSVI